MNYCKGVTMFIYLIIIHFWNRAEKHNSIFSSFPFPTFFLIFSSSSKVYLVTPESLNISETLQSPLMDHCPMSWLKAAAHWNIYPIVVTWETFHRATLWMPPHAIVFLVFGSYSKSVVLDKLLDILVYIYILEIF